MVSRQTALSALTGVSAKPLTVIDSLAEETLFTVEETISAPITTPAASMAPNPIRALLEIVRKDSDIPTPFLYQFNAKASISMTSLLIITSILPAES